LDTLTDLRHLADELTALGDHTTVALVRKVTDRFNRWKFEAGAGWPERALQERCKHEVPEPLRSSYFNTCALAVA
jgi:hypothetical protein